MCPLSCCSFQCWHNAPIAQEQSLPLVHQPPQKLPIATVTNIATGMDRARPIPINTSDYRWILISVVQPLPISFEAHLSHRCPADYQIMLHFYRTRPFIRMAAKWQNIIAKPFIHLWSSSTVISEHYRLQLFIYIYVNIFYWCADKWCLLRCSRPVPFEIQRCSICSWPTFECIPLWKKIAKTKQCSSQ